MLCAICATRTRNGCPVPRPTCSVSACRACGRSAPLPPKRPRRTARCRRSPPCVRRRLRVRRPRDRCSPCPTWDAWPRVVRDWDAERSLRTTPASWSPCPSRSGRDVCGLAVSRPSRGWCRRGWPARSDRSRRGLRPKSRCGRPDRGRGPVERSVRSARFP